MGKGQRKAEVPLAPRTFRVTIPWACQGCRASHALPGVGTQGAVNPRGIGPRAWDRNREGPCWIHLPNALQFAKKAPLLAASAGTTSPNKVFLWEEFILSP